jgi:excisionase family DNA binding protein
MSVVSTPPPLLTTDEVAGQLRIHRKTVLRLVHNGELVAHRFGQGEQRPRGYRFEQAAVDAYKAATANRTMAGRDDAPTRVGLLAPQLNAVLRRPEGEALGRARAFDAQRAVHALRIDQPHLTEADAYRLHFASEIGPREVGTVYANDGGTYEVIDMHFGADARDFLSNAAWALTVRNLVTKNSLTIREAWNSRDRVISQPFEVLAGVSA